MHHQFIQDIALMCFNDLESRLLIYLAQRVVDPTCCNYRLEAAAATLAPSTNEPTTS